ncbi:DUF362 domain-containing protein [Candidatus Peregrinibacteria bacterium]|nr:DUF362 domain-containing protein [Candidatus Peregrinibacteria bacterium]
MITYSNERGRVDVHPAWTTPEIKATIARMLSDWEHKLPADRDTPIVIKPNLNNDLVALTGNCVDLRVLSGICAGLRDRGYRDITLCDGSNVGIARRGISTFRRLRVEKLQELYGIKIVDLNHDEGRQIVLHRDAHPQIAKTVLDAGFLISVPKIKTHCEAQLSCAMKNWVGIARGQDKRHMHYDLGRNIFAINEVVMPDLVIVDGIVGMEGNGPGDGEPFRFGQLIISDNAFLNDFVVARLIDLPWTMIPYLVHAMEAGHMTPALQQDIELNVPVIRAIKRAPERTKLAELAEARSLEWLKRTVRPIVQKPEVTEIAYKLKIVQDVYFLEDDTLKLVGRKAGSCGECNRCEEFCPTGLTREEIGVKTEMPDCVQCLYCWWVCPKEALTLEGKPEFMQRQIDRYKAKIHHLDHKVVRMKEVEMPKEEGFEIPKILKRKRFSKSEPMSEEAAIERMELVGHDFFLFNNADTKRFAIVYKRKDGYYGIVEPKMEND